MRGIPEPSSSSGVEYGIHSNFLINEYLVINTLIEREDFGEGQVTAPGCPPNGLRIWMSYSVSEEPHKVVKPECQNLLTEQHQQPMIHDCKTDLICKDGIVSLMS